MFCNSPVAMRSLKVTLPVSCKISGPGEIHTGRSHCGSPVRNSSEPRYLGDGAEVERLIRSSRGMELSDYSGVMQIIKQVQVKLCTFSWE